MISLRRMPNQSYASRPRWYRSPSHFSNRNYFGGTTVKAYVRSLYASQWKSAATAALGLLSCALLLALCIPCVSYAQDTGYISGTVIDKSGAAIIGADVLLTNTAGSLTRVTTTNGDG